MKTKTRRSLMNQRPIFLGIGLAIAMSLTLAAFEWRSFYNSVSELSFVPEVIIPINDPLPPVKIIDKKSPPKPKNAEIIKIEEPTVMPPDEPDTSLTTNVSKDDGDDDKNVKGIIDTKDVLVDEDETFTIVEDMPRFKGSADFKDTEKQMIQFNKDLGAFLMKNLRFPERCRDLGYSGKVWINFIIERDGKVSGVNVVRGFCEDADKEALRVISKLPIMEPGKQRGMPVRVEFNIPIHFQIK